MLSEATSKLQLLRNPDNIHYRFAARFQFLKFADSRRYCHIVLFLTSFQHLFLEQESNPVPDNQCYKRNEYLCVQRLIGLTTHSPVFKEGFIFPEQFFGCITVLIKVKGIRSIHLPGCDNNKITPQSYLFIKEPVTFPTIHKIFVILSS